MKPFPKYFAVRCDGSEEFKKLIHQPPFPENAFDGTHVDSYYGINKHDEFNFFIQKSIYWHPDTVLFETVEEFKKAWEESQSESFQDNMAIGPVEIENPHERVHKQWALENGYIKLEPNQSIITWEKLTKKEAEDKNYLMGSSRTNQWVEGSTMFVLGEKGSGYCWWARVPFPYRPKTVKVKMYHSFKKQMKDGLGYIACENDSVPDYDDALFMHEFEREVI